LLTYSAGSVQPAKTITTNKKGGIPFSEMPPLQTETGSV
jgi:hypothetical protein